MSMTSTLGFFARLIRDGADPGRRRDERTRTDAGGREEHGRETAQHRGGGRGNTAQQSSLGVVRINGQLTRVRHRRRATRQGDPQDSHQRGGDHGHGTNSTRHEHQPRQIHRNFQNSPSEPNVHKRSRRYSEVTNSFPVPTRLAIQSHRAADIHFRSNDAAALDHHTTMVREYGLKCDLCDQLALSTTGYIERASSFMVVGLDDPFCWICGLKHPVIDDGARELRRGQVVSWADYGEMRRALDEVGEESGGESGGDRVRRAGVRFMDNDRRARDGGVEVARARIVEAELTRAINGDAEEVREGFKDSTQGPAKSENTGRISQASTLMVHGTSQSAELAEHRAVEQATELIKAESGEDIGDQEGRAAQKKKEAKPRGAGRSGL